MTDSRRNHAFTRRQTLGAMSAAAAGVALAKGSTLSRLAGLDSASAASASASCALTPEQEEGPFYVDLEKVQRNIVAGRPGVPVLLRLRVINTVSCKPIENAALDIWHCDALGKYSHEGSEGTSGQSYLRGVQLTDATGYAEFRTIYPGHYQGRSTHIHVKVHVGGRQSGKKYTGGHVSHTGQLFFSDAVGDTVYRLSPYSRATGSRTRNSADGIFTGEHGTRSRLKLERRGGSLKSRGLLGTITLGVDPTATPEGV